MPRRAQEVFQPQFTPYLLVAGAGALLLLGGLVSLFVQLWVSVRQRLEHAIPLGDPWGGRSLEWATPAPPPEYNFFTLPFVQDRDAFMWMKENDLAYLPAPHYRDIVMPGNSATGVVIGAAAFFSAFGLVWHLWWMASAGFIVAWAAVIARSFVRETTRTIEDIPNREGFTEFFEGSNHPVNPEKSR